jgi:hypothetical protein
MWENQLLDDWFSFNQADVLVGPGGRRSARWIVTPRSPQSSRPHQSHFPHLNPLALTNHTPLTSILSPLTNHTLLTPKAGERKSGCLPDVL